MVFGTPNNWDTSMVFGTTNNWDTCVVCGTTDNWDTSVAYVHQKNCGTNAMAEVM